MSTIHSAKIRKRWSTNWATPSTSNCAKRISGCNVPIVYIIGHTEYYIVHVGFVWTTRKKCKLQIMNFELDNKEKSVHGARHGKSEEQIYDHQSFNAWKECWKKTDKTWQLTTPDIVSQKLVWTETKCKEMNALAQEDHTNMATKEELERYRSTWNSTIKSSNIQWSIGSSTRLQSRRLIE